MNIIHRRGWELPESLVTPEPVAVNRRSVLAGAALSVAGGLLLPGAARADGAMAPPVDEKYKPGRAVTPEKAATTYNNYYEFSEDKDLWEAAQKMTVSPWSVQIDGLVKTPRTIAYEDLLKQVHLEQRIYRHRCVEAWSMVVPWTGFPMSQLVKIAEPLGSAKYVVFTTVEEPKVMPGLDEPIYPWPYVEGVTIEEAGNELAFITVGMYGKDLPKQNGAPIRMTLPWKYGFKSGKAFVKVSFTEKRPQTMWAAIAPDEYGFWANVNPAVPHPRWSQATERVLGSNERVPTQIYNGYGEYVSSLYDGLKGEKLFM
ncbi:MAG TPA: protein-methionine-sulfoxide reductase catalytic subunit MsrP [Acetobacteraceae bacterium]